MLWGNLHSTELQQLARFQLAVFYSHMEQTLLCDHFKATLQQKWLLNLCKKFYMVIKKQQFYF